jgi:ComF family protein
MLGARKIWARLREDVVALVYPPQCSLCFGVEIGKHCRFLCDPCWQRVQDEPLPPIHLPHAGPLVSTPPAHCDFELAAWQYRGSMEMLIPQMKYQNAHPSLAKIFGALAAERMRAQLQRYFTPQTVLAPVPLHPVRQRERGFNQSELIARAFAAQWRFEVRPRALLRTRYTEQQARLSEPERLRNVKDAFAAASGASFEARSVILVDDVITTGATISACARVVKEAGATSVGAVALARVGGR